MEEKRTKRQRYSTGSEVSLDNAESPRRRPSPQYSPEQGRRGRDGKHSGVQALRKGDPPNLIWDGDTTPSADSYIQPANAMRDHQTHTQSSYRRDPPLFKEYMPVTDKDRITTSRDPKFAFPARFPPSPTAGPSSLHTSVPPPQPPSNTASASSRSIALLSPPASRGTDPLVTQPVLHPIQAISERVGHADISRGSTPPSPPASRDRDSVPRAYAQNQRYDLSDAQGLVRSLSQTSHQSHFSQHSHQSRHSHQSHQSHQSQHSQQSQHSRQSTVRPLSRAPSSSSSNDSDMGEDADELSSREIGSSRPSTANFQRPKRTRVLMTHLQQHRLGILWKQSKFPSTQEREEIASEVGLTPRQVQVWFQNRRQTFRKQIQQNAIPAGSDPADYSDLQKSPRSRRLSLEAANAIANDDRDRQAHWTGGTSSSASSFASRVPGSSHVSSSTPELGADRLSKSGHGKTFAHNPPSPSSRLPGEQEYTAHSTWPQPPMGHRPMTASSGSSQPISLSPYASSSSRPYSMGRSLPERDRWKSYWDGSHPSSSPSMPYSPPPTADPIGKPHSAQYMDNRASDSKRRRQTGGETVFNRDNRGKQPPDLSRPSHLPPSLAALAINRPLDYESDLSAPTALPSLGLSFGSGQGDPSRPAVPPSHWRGDRREDSSQREFYARKHDRFVGDDGEAAIPRPVSAEPRFERGSDREHGREDDRQLRSTSTGGRLPPLSELFR